MNGPGHQFLAGSGFTKNDEMLENCILLFKILIKREIFENLPTAAYCSSSAGKKTFVSLVSRQKNQLNN